MRRKRKMVKKANVQHTFTIPNKLDEEQRVLLADLIIKEIINRTTVKKIDVKSRRFKSYSEEYMDSFEFRIAGKSSRPDLKLTGSMINSLGLISHSTGQITVGYDPGDEEAGKVEGNQIGSYGKPFGDPSKARKFLGLPQRVLRVLISQVESDTISRRIRTENSIVDDIVSRLTTVQPEEE